jgi:hypothetical protein
LLTTCVYFFDAYHPRFPALAPKSVRDSSVSLLIKPVVSLHLKT